MPVALLLLLSQDEVFDQQTVRCLSAANGIIVLLRHIALKSKAHRDIIAALKDPVTVVLIDLFIAVQAALLLDRLPGLDECVLYIISRRDQRPCADALHRQGRLDCPDHADLPVKGEDRRMDRALKTMDRGISPDHLIVCRRTLCLHAAERICIPQRRPGLEQLCPPLDAARFRDQGVAVIQDTDRRDHAAGCDGRRADAPPHRSLYAHQRNCIHKQDQDGQLQRCGQDLGL